MAPAEVRSITCHRSRAVDGISSLEWWCCGEILRENECHEWRSLPAAADDLRCDPAIMYDRARYRYMIHRNPLYRCSSTHSVHCASSGRSDNTHGRQSGKEEVPLGNIDSMVRHNKTEINDNTISLYIIPPPAQKMLSSCIKGDIRKRPCALTQTTLTHSSAPVLRIALYFPLSRDLSTTNLLGAHHTTTTETTRGSIERPEQHSYFCTTTDISTK